MLFTKKLLLAIGLIGLNSKATKCDGRCPSNGRLQHVVFSDKVKDHILEGFIDSTKQVSSDEDCQMLCILNGLCNLFNLGDQNSSFVPRSCQILRFGAGYAIIPKKGWSFRARRCPSPPCVNGGTCFIVELNNTLQCACPEGWTGQTCSDPDCTSSLRHFEKYQDLPTRGALSVKEFSIDGSQFLAFANFYDIANGFNTDSYIYKLNNSSVKFSLHQTIDTTGARDIEHFTIADKHYLAVANHVNGASFQINSAIYQWNGQQFVILQNIPTNAATGFEFFEIFPEMFLAVTNAESLKSVIYKWKDSQFEPFQEIGTEKAQGCTAFVINNDTFIAFAIEQSSQQGFSAQSPVLKWSGGRFVLMQSLQTYGAWDVKSFTNKGDTFLAFANFYNGSKFNIDSFIYKWDGSKFVLFQSIPTRGARAWHPFVMCGHAVFLGVASTQDDNQGFIIRSVVYQASALQIIERQEIPTQAAADMTSFNYNGHTYLAIANHRNNDNKYSINSALYKWV